MRELFSVLYLIYYKGAIHQKIVLTIFAGLSLVPFTEFFTKYMFNDFEFLRFLFILVAVDTFLGVWKSFKLGEGLSKEKAIGFVKKTALYGIVLVVVHNLASFTVGGEQPIDLFYIKYLGYSSILFTEAASIFKNISIINPGLLPAWLLKRIQGSLDEHLTKYLDNERKGDL